MPPKRKRPPKRDNGFAAYYFPGTAPEGVVLIVAGLHTSEQSGVEVANWIRVKLAELPKPSRLSAIVIPEVFPDWGAEARETEWDNPGPKWEAKGGDPADKFREYDIRGQTLYPNRQFPPPSQPLEDLLDKKTGRGTLKKFDGSPVLDTGSSTPMPLLPQIRQLTELIELHKPIRILSIHGIHQKGTKSVAGVFVDPRYAISPTELAEVMKNEKNDNYDLEKYKFDVDADPAYPPKPDPRGGFVPKQFPSARTHDGQDDDRLALALANEVARLDPDPRLVAGNHLTATHPVVHYKRVPNGPRPADTRPGYSLGDWGPVTDWGPVKSGARPGAPVFTIEPDMDFESWAFLDGVRYMEKDGVNMTEQYQRNPPAIRPAKFKPDRSRKLQAYAQAAINILLR